MKKLPIYFVLLWTFFMPQVFAENIAPLHGKATASSTYSDRVPDNAIDGNPEIIWNASSWGTAVNPEWLIVDLQNIFDVSQITLQSPDTNGNFIDFTNIYKLFVSADGELWTLVGEGTLYDSTDSEKYSDTITIPPELSLVQYVKYEVVGGTHWAHLGEMEIEGVLHENPQAQNYPVVIIGGIFCCWSTEMFNNDQGNVGNVETWLHVFTNFKGKIPAEWTLDPIKGTYDDLRTFFKEQYGNNMVFDFPYDWRQSIADSAYGLKNRIDEIKAITGAKRVRLVAHSMGGLVARYYMTYFMPVDADVEAFVPIGTPQNGSSVTYKMQEEGNFPSNYIWQSKPVASGLEVILENMKQSYDGYSRGRKEDLRFIKEKIPSIAQLMPTYEFVFTKAYDGRKLKFKGMISPDQLCERNYFLESLNADIDTFMQKSKNTRKKIFASKAFYRTIDRVKTRDKELGVCQDYAPDGNFKSVKKHGRGDGRVLFNKSAVPRETLPEMFEGENPFTVSVIKHKGKKRGKSAKHGDLPSNTQLLRELNEFFGPVTVPLKQN